MSELQSITRQFLNSHRQTILRAGVVAGAMAVALMTGRFIANRTLDFTMLIGALAAPIVILVFFRLGRFEYGFFAVAIAAGLFNFFSLPTGTDSRIVLSLLVAGVLVAAWLLEMLVVKRRLALKPSPINRPVLLFVAANFIAYVWSFAFRDPVLNIWRSFPVVQLAALGVNILLPLLALLLSNKINESKWLRWLTWLMIGTGTFVVLSLLLNLPTYALWTRGASGLFATWVTALAFALALFDKSLKPRLRALLLLVVAAWVFRNFIQSRIWLSGWVPLLAALFVITMIHSRRLLTVSIVAGLIFVAVNFDSLYQEVVVANQEEGGEQRFGLWEINLGHVSHHPFFGMGPAGYAVYNMTYNPQDARSTHNNYFDILAQTGVVGFAIFVWLLISFMRIGRRNARMLRGRRDFEEALAAATLGGFTAAIVAMMLGDWVIPFAYNSTIAGFDHAAFTWLFAGSMVSLHHIIRARAQQDTPPSA